MRTRLEETQRAAVARLCAQFDELGAEDPAEWARSEVGEDIPQLARFLVLRSLWRQAVDGWSRPDAIEHIAAGRRLLRDGAAREDLVRLARAAAYEAVLAVLTVIDEGRDGEAPGDCPGWLLLEVDEDCHQTGRVVDGLSEDFLTTDPSGRDGADLWK